MEICIIGESCGILVSAIVFNVLVILIFIGVLLIALEQHMLQEMRGPIQRPRILCRTNMYIDRRGSFICLHVRDDQASHFVRKSYYFIFSLVNGRFDDFLFHLHLLQFQCSV